MDYLKVAYLQQLISFVKTIKGKLSDDLLAVKLYGSTITSKTPHDLDVAIIVKNSVNDPIQNSVNGRTYCIPELHDEGVLIRRFILDDRISIHYIIIPQKTWYKKAPSEPFTRFKQSVMNGFDLFTLINKNKYDKTS